MIDFKNLERAPTIEEILDNQEAFASSLDGDIYSMDPVFATIKIFPGVIEATSNKGERYLVGHLMLLREEKTKSIEGLRTYDFPFYTRSVAFGLVGLSKIKMASEKGTLIQGYLSFESSKRVHERLVEEGIQLYGEDEYHDRRDLTVELDFIDKPL